MTAAESIAWGHGLGLSSGQREPEYGLLTPYESMPKQISGRTVWTKEELMADTSRWIRPFTDIEIRHIQTAVQTIESQDLDLSQINRSTFPLPPTLILVLEETRDELINGIGFFVLRGLPVNKWTVRQSSIAYLGLSSHFGNRLSQNGMGHMLGHIKDLSEGKEENGQGRLYRTHKAQSYHADDCDIVGLLCLHKALEGGESQVVSTHHVYNILTREREDVLELLCKAHWFYDRKGDTSFGEKEWMRTPCYYFYKGKLTSKWDSYYVGALQRFWDKGLLPVYTDAQREAIVVMEEVCGRLALEMVLERGDVQFVANTHVLHARSEYKDAEEEGEKRWLQRVWLATPEEEGGWPLPFADSKYFKRGGVQVNKTLETYPLEAQ